MKNTSNSDAFITNRWLRVLVYGLAVTFTSCLYGGWQQYSLILLKGGKYSWVCAEGTTREDPELPGLFTCPEQERRVSNLFPVASGFELLGAIVAGIGLDKLGPRVSALIGLVVGGFSYVLLIISREGLDLLPTSMVINGAAINMAAFPALILEDYFPGAAATTAAFVISCQALSSIVAPGLWLLWRWQSNLSFAKLWGSYLIFIWIPVSILFVLALPMRRALGPCEIESPILESVEPLNDASVADLVIPSEEPSAAIEIEAARLHVEQSNSSLEAAPFLWADVLRYLCTPQFIVMSAIGMVMMLQNAYYQVIVRPTMGVAISDFLGYTMPSQAIWGLLIGRLCDRVKTPLITAGLFVLYGVLYAMIYAGRSPVQYATVTLFNIAMSYAFTTKYSYVQETFPAVYYGTLVGVSGCLNGIGVFATNILTQYGTVSVWAGTLAASSVLCLPFCLWLHKSRGKQGGHVQLQHSASSVFESVTKSRTTSTMSTDQGAYEELLDTTTGLPGFSVL